MLNFFLLLVFSLAAMSVSCAPAYTDFQPQLKKATTAEIIAIVDDKCPIVIPFPVEADTYFIFEEEHKGQMVKNTLLVCDDKPHGTHPTPILACGQITAIEGDFDKLPQDCENDGDEDHIHVKIQGKFKGVAFNYVNTFVNPDNFKCVTKPIKEFVSIGLGL